MLNHLEVAPGWQGQGIGTRLVRAAEDAARRRGFDRIVLGVGVDNPDAKRLYERLGYVDWEQRSGGRPMDRTGWGWRDPGGVAHVRHHGRVAHVIGG